MNHMAKRIMMSFCGIVITGICIAMTKISNLGTDPFSCLNLGISNVTGFSYGIIFTAVTAVLLTGVFFLNRRYIGVSTLLTLFFIGLIAEKAMIVLEILFPDPSMPVRIVLLAVGLILFCFSASLYYTADLGVSSYDACALITSERTPIPFRFCRIASDIICVAAGFFMGNVPGIGTIFTAFCMGPLIEIFNKKFSVPFLQGEFFHMSHRPHQQSHS